MSNLSLKTIWGLQSRLEFFSTFSPKITICALLICRREQTETDRVRTGSAERPADPHHFVPGEERAGHPFHAGRNAVGADRRA